jgi:hypothetical protein
MAYTFTDHYKASLAAKDRRSSLAEAEAKDVEMTSSYPSLAKANHSRYLVKIDSSHVQSLDHHVRSLVPEWLTEAETKRLSGHAFNEAAFAAARDPASGRLSRADFLARRHEQGHEQHDGPIIVPLRPL